MSLQKHITEKRESERTTQEQARNVNRLRVWKWKKKQLIRGCVPVVIFGEG